MTDEPREQVVVTGVVGGATQRGDKWIIEVTPNGSQYAKKLWTKSAPQHEALVSLYGQPVSVLCNVSEYERDGKPVRSLWVDTIGYDGPAPVQEAPRAAEAPSAPQSAISTPVPGAMPASLGDPRQTSIERQTAVKVAVEYMALLPEELRSVEQMIAVAERIALFLASGVGAEAIPF